MFMLTKAGKLLLRCGWTATGVYENYDNLKWKALNNGNDVWIVPSLDYLFTGKDLRFDQSSNGIIVGSGNTTPTENDYQLDSQILSGLSVTSSFVRYGGEGTKIGYVGNYMITNSSNEDITIKEYGYQLHKYQQRKNGSSIAVGQFPILLSRSVLETPVTIPANSSNILILDIYADISDIVE